MDRRIRTARPKLSPVQFIKGSIIRLGLAEKVKVRKANAGPDDRGAKVRFRLIWHRIGLLFLGLALLGWTSLATAAYFFVKEARNFPEVRFVDIAFPHRWDYYRVARGDYYIAQAQELLQAGEIGNVIHLLRVGVQQSPDNTEGRLTLAQIYSVMGRPDLGIQLLQARVDEHAGDTNYLSALISLLFANHEDTAAEKLATRLLAGSTEPTDRNLVLAVAAATANFNRGNYDQAERIIQEFDLFQSRTGTLLQARIDYDLGEKQKAIAHLERIMLNPGAQEAQVVEFLIEALWSSGREDRAQQVAFDRFIDNPLSFAPRIRLLYIYDKRGDARKAAELETYFRLFADDENAMRALAEFAANSEKPDLAERIYRHVRAKGQASVWPAIFLLDARIAAGNYRQALDFYQTIEKETGDWTPLQQARLQPILIAAYLGIDNTEQADLVLNEMIARGNVPPSQLMSLAERLTKLEKFTRAREVLQHIHVNEPLNQEALTRLIELDLKTGNNREIVRNLDRLLKMRKPSLVVLEEAHRHISSDRFLFQANRGHVLESLETALVSAQSRGS